MRTWDYTVDRIATILKSQLGNDISIRAIKESLNRTLEFQLLSPSFAAEFLSMPRYTLMKKARRGEIASIRSGRYTRFRLYDLCAWIDAHRTQTKENKEFYIINLNK